MKQQISLQTVQTNIKEYRNSGPIFDNLVEMEQFPPQKRHQNITIHAI